MKREFGKKKRGGGAAQNSVQISGTGVGEGGRFWKAY